MVSVLDIEDHVNLQGKLPLYALMRCKPVSVSVGRLMEFLTLLGQDIEVTVKPAVRRKAGDMSVVVQGA